MSVVGQKIERGGIRSAGFYLLSLLGNLVWSSLSPVRIPDLYGADPFSPTRSFHWRNYTANAL